MDGNASSEEGNDGAEEGKGSVGAEGNDCAKAGKGSVDVAGKDSAEVGGCSAKEGKTSGSTDSCACAARTAVKKIPAVKAMIDHRGTGRVISPAISIAVRSENGAKRRIIDAKPERTAARLEWHYQAVNRKNGIKIIPKDA